MLGPESREPVRCSASDERTIQRWRAEPERDDARRGPLTPPAHALDAQERARLIDVATCQEFCDLPPAQIVARLADRGEYLASESTFYRVLHEQDMAAPRGPTKPRHPRPRPVHAASAPNQVGVWDITYLKTKIAGQFFYLYLFEGDCPVICVNSHLTPHRIPSETGVIRGRASGVY